MNFGFQKLILLLWCTVIVPAAPKDETLAVEGAVVAIQRSEKDTRIIDPPSFADLVEVYMMRVDHWSRPQKQNYIIVEYIHRADLISYERFDTTLWRFEVHQASPEETKDCFSWIARGPSFLPTAFGAKSELPNPKDLPCFLMTERPVPVPQSKVAPTVASKDGSLHLETK